MLDAAPFASIEEFHSGPDSGTCGWAQVAVAQATVVDDPVPSRLAPRLDPDRAFAPRRYAKNNTSARIDRDGRGFEPQPETLLPAPAPSPPATDTDGLRCSNLTPTG